MQKPNQKRFTRHAASVAKARAFVVEVLGDRPIHGRLDDVRVWGVPVVRPARALDDAGRGMVLVDGLSDAWGVEARRGPGKAVWVEFRIGRQ